MKPIKIKDKEFQTAICSGEYYLEVGDRKFLLVEVDKVMEPNFYGVKDSEEENKLLKALYGKNPIMNDDEIYRLLEDK